MLSEFRRKKFSVWFHHLDLDDDLQITEADFIRYAEALASLTDGGAEDPVVTELVQATTKFWLELLDHAANDDGRVSLEEGLNFFEDMGQRMSARGAPPQWAMNMVQAIHHLLAPDEGGVVRSDRYALWLRAIGSEVDPAEAFGRLDLTRSGGITRTEMAILFGQYLLSEDPAAPGNYLMTGAL